MQQAMSIENIRSTEDPVASFTGMTLVDLMVAQVASECVPALVHAPTQDTGVHRMMARQYEQKYRLENERETSKSMDFGKSAHE